MIGFQATQVKLTLTYVVWQEKISILGCAYSLVEFALLVLILLCSGDTLPDLCSSEDHTDMFECGKVYSLLKVMLFLLLA